MDANWHRHLIKNRSQLRKAIFKKSCSPCSESSIFQDSGDEVVSKNRPKIDQKMKPRRDDISASIFYRFFLIFRAKLASWAPLGSLLAASWRHLGRLGSVWGVSWGVLGHLGESKGVLEASWARLGSQNHPKINPPASRSSAAGHDPPPDLPLI